MPELVKLEKGGRVFGLQPLNGYPIDGYVPVFVSVLKGRPYISPGWSDVRETNVAQPWVGRTTQHRNPERVTLSVYGLRSWGRPVGAFGSI